MFDIIATKRNAAHINIEVLGLLIIKSDIGGNKNTKMAITDKAEIKVLKNKERFFTASRRINFLPEAKSVISQSGEKLSNSDCSN